jgi:predicted histidine transporter YuiF (NhaC family)
MDNVTKALLEQGVLGLVIVLLIGAVVFLYKKVNEVQEKRIVESRESIKAIEQSTNTLDTLTEVLRERGKTSQ